jgi:hypothetical protein
MPKLEGDHIAAYEFFLDTPLTRDKTQGRLSNNPTELPIKCQLKRAGRESEGPNRYRMGQDFAAYFGKHDVEATHPLLQQFGASAHTVAGQFWIVAIWDESVTRYEGVEAFTTFEEMLKEWEVD